MKTLKSISLYFQEGSSDKEYHIQLVQETSGYVVNFQYGRRGAALKGGTKTDTPVDLPKAEKIYESLLREKKAKGYQEDTTGATASAYTKVSNLPYLTTSSSTQNVAHITPQLLNIIDNPEYYIDNDNYLAQEKKDGERRMIINSKSNVIGLNKKGIEVPLPNAIALSIVDLCILDGEIIGEQYFVFDILYFNGVSLKELPCQERIKLLSTLKFGKSITIVPTAYTKEEKGQMYIDLQNANKEGIVFKNKYSVYKSGRPNSGGDQLKFKFYKTATFIVANMTANKRSVGVELIGSQNNRVFMGKVTIPPNFDIPDIGDLVEIRYLYAYKDGAIYQPVYLGIRNDSDLSDATMKQIIYKAE